MSQKIPDAVIASVKNNVSFLSLLRRYGIPVKKSGKSYKAVCPFHDVDGHPEKTPSLSINTITNVYNCFSCGSKGNVIQFVEAMEKVSFPQAVEQLLALRGEKLTEEKAVKEKKKDTEPPSLTDEQRQMVLREVVAATTDSLRNNRQGREYLESRGLDPLQLLESYTIGFWDKALFNKLAGSEKKKLSDVGLYTNSRALFDNCIMLPLEKHGRITTIYGRKVSTNGSETVGKSFDATQGRHYLLPGKREGLFLPCQGLNPQIPIIITESIIDALSLFTAGITNVLPLLGVNGFLSDHLDYLKEHCFPMIYIALNGDEAGNKSAAKLKEILTGQQLPSVPITLAERKDLNDLLVEWGPGKLKEWFTKKIQTEQRHHVTVWEDDIGDIFMLKENREYRVRGLSTFGLDRLRVNVRVCLQNNYNEFYVDTLDLYQSRTRELFISHSSRTLNKEPAAVAQDINRLITVLEEKRLAKKRNTDPAAGTTYTMSEHERQEALDYLKAPDLIQRIVADFEACGMVGNHNNNLLAYLGALSRLNEKPFGILIVSRSGAGKSFLQDMVGSFTPEENLLRMTRLTGQSLFYQGKEGLKHKLLSIEEDEGMQEAMYSIRTLLSSQKLSVHGLKTDPKTGEFKAYANVVEGPASVMISTTDLAAINHESVTRFFIVHMDESREQTRAILEHQRKNSGPEKIRIKLARERIGKLHRNIQRLLQPLAVSNPLGTGVDYPEDILHTRRESTKTESLIETVALLHQYQRPIQQSRFYGITSKYIEVAREDIELVHQIGAEVLRQSLDELSKLCRELLEYIHTLVNDKFKAAVKLDNNVEYWRITFTRKELRDQCKWSRWHLEEHLKELEEAGYIVKRIGRKGQRYAYSLVEDTIPEPPQIQKINGKSKNLQNLLEPAGKLAG